MPRFQLLNRSCSLSSKSALNKILDDFFEQPHFEERNYFFSPPVELKEETSAFEIKAQLPGLEKSEVEVSIENNELLIAGEYKNSADSCSTNSICRSEFRYGKFSRRIELPLSIDVKKAKANFENGILSVIIPKEKQEDNIIKLKL